MTLNHTRKSTMRSLNINGNLTTTRSKQTLHGGLLKGRSVNQGCNYCKLCLTEKHVVLKSLDDPNLLNSRSEFVSKCRHDNKYLIKSVKKNGVG